MLQMFRAVSLAITGFMAFAPAMAFAAPDGAYEGTAVVTAHAKPGFECQGGNARVIVSGTTLKVSISFFFKQKAAYEITWNGDAFSGQGGTALTHFISGNLTGDHLSFDQRGTGVCARHFDLHRVG